MWVPNLAGTNNLLSIPQLVRKGCDITIRDQTCIITDRKSQQQFLTGTFDGKGFYVDMATCPTSLNVAKLTAVPVNDSGNVMMSILPVAIETEPTAMLGGTEDTQPLEIWHMRLGHLGERAIRDLVTQSTGMKIGSPTPQTLHMRCEPCLRGSQHRQISYKRGNPAQKLLEHVWADVKGPLLEKDVYGFKYFVIFIDEKSRFTTVYPLLQKTDVFAAYKLFEARMERVAGCQILNLHVDMGGEWTLNEMRAHCRNRGIEILFTAGYTPNMNSISERTIRTIIEHASLLLWAANLPVGFWACAVKTSVYLLNRSPHSALEGLTPYQAWHGKKPNLGHLRVFGCRAAAHNPDELRGKTSWTSKSTTDCIFVGYSETENLFELWDVYKKTILRKRDVIFWEHQMGHPLLTPKALPHGVSIYADVAGEMIPALTPINQQNQLPSTLNNNMPLLPLPSQQTITRLNPEQPTTTQWIQATPDDMAAADQRERHRRQIHTLPTMNLNVSDITAMTMMEDTSSTGMDPPILPINSPHPPDLPSTNDIRQCFEITPTTESLEQSIVPMITPGLSIPRSCSEALRHPHAIGWQRAMSKQMQSLIDNETWELVDLPAGKRALPNKWIFSYVSGAQLTDTHDIEKARLVARGDLQRPGDDYCETYAPVVKLVSLRVLLTWAKLKKLQVVHWDVVSAFLHSDIGEIEL